MVPGINHSIFVALHQKQKLRFNSISGLAVTAANELSWASSATRHSYFGHHSKCLSNSTVPAAAAEEGPGDNI